MATFIDNLTESESAIELARFVNKIYAKTKGKPEGDESFFEECSKLNESNKHFDLLLKIVEELNTIIIESDKEAESLIFIVLSLGSKIEKESFSKIITKLVQQISSNVDDKSLLRFKLLNAIYNALPSSSERYNVFMDLLRYGIASKNTDIIVNQVSETDLDTRISEWNLNINQRRELLQFMRNIILSNKSSNSLRWSLKYLSTFGSDVTAITENELEDVSKIVIEAIRLNSVFQYDRLYSMPVIKRLESSKHKPLYQLLKIFVEENLESYQNFATQNSALLNSLGLNHDENLKKMRLLTLASLAVENHELPYSVISKSLQIPDSEVEIWIISAISEDIIVAKMDQLRRVVIILRSLQRNFSKAQWTQIKDGLSSWKEQIHLLLNSLQETKKLNKQVHPGANRALQQLQLSQPQQS